MIGYSLECGSVLLSGRWPLAEPHPSSQGHVPDDADSKGGIFSAFFSDGLGGSLFPEKNAQLTPRLVIDSVAMSG